MILFKAKPGETVPNNRNKLSRPANKLVIVFDGKDDVIYELDYQSRLRWKRKDVCHSCAGHGYRGMVKRTVLGVRFYFKCEMCGGSGWTRDRLDYNSGHREI